MDPTKIQVRLDSINALRERQRFDLEVLGLWAHALTIGKTHDDIRTFTFRPEFLTDEEAKENKRASIRNRPPVYCSKNWHNCVRLNSGELVSMPGIKRPIPPPDTKSDARKVTDIL
jgi:hypothetical protein